jgi:hypothetical protein
VSTKHEALATARKNARTDADAVAIAWAEETIAHLSKLLEKQTAKTIRDQEQIRRLRAANEKLRRALEETTLYVRRLAAAAKTGEVEE